MTIQPSANCQLGCHYCGQNHTKHYASEPVIDKYHERIEYLLSQKNDYKGLSITWYGGEPLTGYSSILKASEALIGLAERNKIHYVSDMITNGLSLKPSLFKELVLKCKVTNYQITIDGVAEAHDKRRITKEGHPTFDIITRNIINVVNTDLYESHHCHISIRVNIDKTNHQFVEPLIDFINDHDLNSKVSMYFAPIVDFGGNDAGKDALEKNFFAEKEVEWLLKCYEYNIPVKTLPSRSSGEKEKILKGIYFKIVI